jgi:hypothetical protein
VTRRGGGWHVCDWLKMKAKCAELVKNECNIC